MQKNKQKNKTKNKKTITRLANGSILRAHESNLCHAHKRVRTAWGVWSELYEIMHALLLRILCVVSSDLLLHARSVREMYQSNHEKLDPD